MGPCCSKQQQEEKNKEKYKPSPITEAPDLNIIPLTAIQRQPESFRERETHRSQRLTTTERLTRDPTLTARSDMKELSDIESFMSSWDEGNGGSLSKKQITSVPRIQLNTIKENIVAKQEVVEEQFVKIDPAVSLTFSSSSQSKGLSELKLNSSSAESEYYPYLLDGAQQISRHRDLLMLIKERKLNSSAITLSQASFMSVVNATSKYTWTESVAEDVINENSSEQSSILLEKRSSQLESDLETLKRSTYSSNIDNFPDLMTQKIASCSENVSERKKDSLSLSSSDKSVAMRMYDVTVYTRTDGHLQVNQYIIDKTMESGTYGTVHEARDTHRDRQVIIKIAKKALLKKRMVAKGTNALMFLENEISILEQLDHPNIVRLYEVMESPKKLYIVLEHAKGDKIEAIIPLQEEKVRGIFTRLIKTLDYLHNMAKIVHRDIKLDNLICDEDDNIKLVDFWSAHSIAESDYSIGAVGTSANMAPEIHRQDQKIRSRPLDIWAAGITLYQILFGKIPFTGTKYTERAQSIWQDEVAVPDDVSTECKELIQMMLDKDPKTRCTIPDILTSNWVTKNGTLRVF